jgi:hypothetical protein
MIAQEIQDEYETLHTDIEESIGIANLWNDDIVAKKWRKSFLNLKAWIPLMRSWINSAEFVMVCILSFDSFLKFELSKHKWP